jgi:uncharacterized protein YodC (DUF2158 family)
MSEVKVGDVVQLRSGGPLMTVSQVGKVHMSEINSVWVDWFVQDKTPWKQDSGVFPVTSVKVIETE